MWPFKKKSSYVTATEPGVVESIMYDHVIISGKRYDCRCPLVEHGHSVIKNQPIGKP